jgi:hypothetical protein
MSDLISTLKDLAKGEVLPGWDGVSLVLLDEWGNKIEKNPGYEVKYSFTNFMIKDGKNWTPISEHKVGWTQGRGMCVVIPEWFDVPTQHWDSRKMHPNIQSDGAPQSVVSECLWIHYKVSWLTCSNIALSYECALF